MADVSPYDDSFEITELTWLSRTRNRKWCSRSIASVAMEWKKYFRHLHLRNRACSERHFSRQLNKSGKENSVYHGRSAAVVSDRTPFIFEFHIEKQRVSDKFYIQRYTFIYKYLAISRTYFGDRLRRQMTFFLPPSSFAFCKLPLSILSVEI